MLKQPILPAESGLAVPSAAGITDDRDVRGYLPGSLPGNHDRHSGYQGRCGVLGVDRVIQRRWARPGAAGPDAAARGSGIA
jgi:hypothetical protein